MAISKPSSQGTSPPPIIKRPPRTTPRDNPGQGSGTNAGPKFGGDVKKGM